MGNEYKPFGNYSDKDNDNGDDDDKIMSHEENKQ